MPFAKGTSGNSNGRTKDVPNKVTTKVREMYSLFVELNMERLQDDFDQLEPKERIDVLLKLSEYVVPKLQRQVVVQEQAEIQRVIEWGLDAVDEDDFESKLSEHIASLPRIQEDTDLYGTSLTDAELYGTPTRP
jgi:hypothetical protein